jgi:hypothetical protein
MPVAIQTRCPNPRCGKSGFVPSHFRDRTVRCPDCKRKFAVVDCAVQEPAIDCSRQVDTVDWWLETTEHEPGEKQSQAPPASEVPARVGRFEIRGELGAGAYGKVYRAYDPHLKREIALKVLRPNHCQTPRRVERFLREGEAAGKLLHPHIVPVYEAGQDPT